MARGIESERTRRIRVDAFLNVVRALARAELDDAEVGEAVRVERIFTDDSVDLFAALANRQDDAAVTRDFSSRDDKVPRRVILLQELHVRRHVRVDFCKFSFVNELDDEHAQNSTAQCPSSRRAATVSR